jgi:galactokinase
MAIAISIPARINILGNPSDGNEGDFATISTAVNLYAGASAEEYPTILLRSLSARSGNPYKNSTILETAEFTPSQLPLPYDGKLNLVKAAFNRLYQYSQELRQKVERQGICLSFWSEVPRQSGLGGSSLLIAYIAVCALYDLTAVSTMTIFSPS